MLRAGLMVAVIALEWYAMQPYQEPVMARLWLAVSVVARRMALWWGRLALHAEHSYYIAAEAGL